MAMLRKKKIIWWKGETFVSRAEEARKMGSLERHGHGYEHRRRTSAPFWAPMTLHADPDETAGPDAPGLTVR
jgi:hypothetical protein